MSFGLGINGALGGASQGATIGSAIPGIGTAEELKEILENHRRWLYRLDGIKERANLCDANLCGASLYSEW